MRLYRIIQIFTLFLFTGFYGQAQELRGGVEWERKFKPKIETELKFQLRKNFNNTLYSVNSSIFQANFGFEPINNLSLTGSFRYAGTMKADDEKSGLENYEDKYRVAGDITYKIKKLIKNTQLSTRLRYQYSRKDIDKEDTYIRIRTKCEYKFTKRVVPYIALEPYYSIGERTWNTYRFYLGSEYKLLKNKIDVFLIVDVSERDSDLNTNKIIGITYKL